MAVEDVTFRETSAYGSVSWCAERLGRSVDWFRRNRPDLERDGFPRTDPLVGHVLKDDVDAWLKGRRRLSDPDSVTVSVGQQPSGVNYGRF